MNDIWLNKMFRVFHGKVLYVIDYKKSAITADYSDQNRHHPQILKLKNRKI